MWHRGREGGLVHHVCQWAGREALGNMLHGAAAAGSGGEDGRRQEGHLQVPQGRRQELSGCSGQVLEQDPWYLQHQSWFPCFPQH